MSINTWNRLLFGNRQSIIANSSGWASIIISGLPIGSYSLDAEYTSSDDTYLSSTSSSDIVQIDPDGTTETSVTSSTSDVFQGSAVTFTATVDPSDPSVTTSLSGGTVEFLSGGTVLASTSLNSSNTATFSTSSLPIGDYNITALYMGTGSIVFDSDPYEDSTFLSSSSSPAGVQVYPTGSDFINLIGPDFSTVTVNQATTWTATVSSAVSGSTTPTGTVTLLDADGDTLASGTLDDTGTVVLTVSAQSASYAVTAEYSGDSTYTATNSPPIPVTVVSEGTTNTTLTASLNQGDAGAAVTYTATVVVSSSTAVSPTGSVTFADDAGTLGTVTLSSSWTATYSTTIAEGDAGITATYNPPTSGNTDPTLVTSEGGIYVFGFPSGTTFTTLAIPATTNDDGSVTLSANVSTGGDIPTGSVTFSIDGTAGTAVDLDANGNASKVVDLGLGSHTIEVNYSGATGFLTSSSDSSTVIAYSSLSTQVSLDSALSPTESGQPATFVANVTPNGNTSIPTGTVTFLDAGITLGTVPLDANGTALYSTEALPAGAQNITAVYNSNGALSDSTSAPFSQTVVPVGSTTTTLTIDTTINADDSAGNPEQTVDQGLTMTATVARLITGAEPTGYVELYFNGNFITSQALDNNGTASFSDPNAGDDWGLSGITNFSFLYIGDGSALPSISSNTTVDFLPSYTQLLSVTSSESLAATSQTITFTATLTPLNPSDSLAAGHISYWVDSGTHTNVTINSSTGVATWTKSWTSAGTHTITVSYAGDAGTIESSTSVQIMASTGTITTLDVPADASTAQAVTLTAWTTAANGSTPAGSVEFTDTYGTLGTVALSDGMATLTATLSTANSSDQVTATYIPSGSLSASTSPASSVDVIASGSRQIGLSSSANPAEVDQPVILTAAVSALAPGDPTPTGTVTFYHVSGSTLTLLGTTTLDDNGNAEWLLAYPGTSSDTVIATYSGDENFASISSSNLVQTYVPDGAVAISFSPASSSVEYGVPEMLSVTLTPVAQGEGIPAGSVTFYDGTTALGTATLDPTGYAELVTNSLTLGTHADLTVTYAPIDGFEAGTSAAASVAVVPATTNLYLEAHPLDSDYGEIVTLAAILSIPGAGTPTGTVSFYSGSTFLGSSSIADSAATLTTSTMAVGTSSLTAIYSGSTDFDTSTSNAVQVDVSQNVTTTTISETANASTSGQAVTFTVSISPISPGSGTPTGDVDFYDNGSRWTETWKFALPLGTMMA